ncbi:MAG: spore maturation protein [Lachnospiraceae bacterium]|nr:spore maturation protein [Lachnospiraceae bacterium]MBQ4068006.1 spore maturation protein [Lachnospiraceae bacterium]
MNLILFISNSIIPLVIFYIVAHGLINKQNIYSDFIKGATEGIKIVVNLVPTLIGLMIAVGTLSSSGFLTFLAGLIGNTTKTIGLPAPVVPIAIVKIFSSSAANGLVIDLFKEYGPDSYEGFLGSVILASTETIFYTMSVYFIAAKVIKTKWTLAGALICTLAGILGSIITVSCIM